MIVQDPSYYRARIRVIERLILELGRERNTFSPQKDEYAKIQKQIGLLRNGFFPPELDEQGEIWREVDNQSGPLDNSPLTFMELTRYSTWFHVHPDRLLGYEEVTTSREFPLTTKGGVDAAEFLLISCTDKLKSSMDMSTQKENSAQSLAEKLRALRRNRTKPVSGGFTLSGIKGLDGLGALPDSLLGKIEKNLPAVKTVMDKSKDNRKKTRDILSFQEVVNDYNAGISIDEIRAWVWYRRTLGTPMTGWEEYFLSGGGERSVMLVTTRETVIRANNFKEIQTVPAGRILGRFTGKSHQINERDPDTILLIYRDDEGLKMVKKSDVREVKSDTGYATQKELDHLVQAGALYYLDGELLPLPVYSYGNAYDLLLQVERDKEYIITTWGEEVFVRHQSIVEKSKPPLLSVMNADPRERPKILAISDFARDEFRLEMLRPETGIEFSQPVSLLKAFVTWLDKLDHSEFKSSSRHDIVEHYILGHKITREKEADKRAEIKANARNDAEELFTRFLYEALTTEDQQKLDFTWNRLYNGQSSLAYHKVPIGFELSGKFKGFTMELRPAQREGIAFINALGSGIVAFDVGVGKTMTAIGCIADALQCGKAKRPLIVVPNATYKKWIGEIIGISDKKGNFLPGMLTGTSISLNEWYNLGKDVAKELNLNKAVPEKSITIVTYEGFKRIGFGKKVVDEMFVELTNVLEQSDDHISARNAEIKYNEYLEMIGTGLKDTIGDIETLGFDMIVIDEAHRCKNIFSGVKKDQGGRKRYSLEGPVSETGVKAFFLCNYIQRRYGRNVILLTATPFTNSPLEIYSMLSLVGLSSMRKMNLININVFFQLFVLESTEFVVDYKEEIVAKSVIKRFNNRLILQKLIYNHILYKTGEEAGIKRPCKINLPRINVTENGMSRRLSPSEQIVTYLAMTPDQRANQNEINSEVRSATYGKFNMLAVFKALNQSLDNALSPFLYEKEAAPEDYMDFVNSSPKIQYCLESIRSVKKWHEARNEPVSGQVIYLNRGKQFFHFMKEYLEKQCGYKTGIKYGRYSFDQVEIITSELAATRKEAIKEAFLDGVVKVVIGTSTIREGIDLQRKGTVLYNLYPDWNPTDLRQLEGRIWRQGNEFGYVRVVMPLVQDSMDVFIFQKLEEKTNRINDIWYRGDRGNVLDLESLDPEEIKMALMTDVRAIAEMVLKQHRAEAERKIHKIESSLEVLSTVQRDYAGYLNYRGRVIEDLRHAKKDMENSYPAISQPPSEAEMERLSRPDREEVIRQIEAWNDLLKLLESAPIEDKEILRVCRKLRNFTALNDTNLLYFKEYLAKSKKAEKTVLAQKGFTLDSDLSLVMEEFRKDEAAAKAELARINTEGYLELLIKEVTIKKSAMQIEGKTVPERVEEFSRLNYLLGYKSSDVEAGSCVIPQPGTVPPASGPDFDEASAFARALALKLKLLRLRHQAA